jgi:hypothetical protein
MTTENPQGGGPQGQRASDRRARSIRKRDRLLSLLPLLSPEKAEDVRYELQKLDAEIGPDRPDFTKSQPDLDRSAAGVNGVGGLMFQTEAPPGAGRMVRVPLYLYDANFTQLSFQAPEVGPMVLTSNGANQVDETNPTVIVTMPNDPSGRRVLSGFLFRSPVIEWARLRVVGLETCQVQTVYGGQAPANQILAPSPLPTSPVNVDGYDVGPGSGETGRYNPYAVTHSPPIAIPIQLVVDNGGWPAQWQVAFTQATPPVLLAPSLPSPILDFGVVESGSPAVTLQVTISSQNKQIDLLSKNWSVSNFSDDAVVGPAFVTNALPGTTVVNITFTPPSGAGSFFGSLRLRLQAAAPAPTDIVDLFISVGATVVQNRYYTNGKLYLLLKNFNIGGGANLLSQEGYIDGALYDSRLAHSPGLRALPELTSPNRAFIEAAVVGPELTTMTFSINLLCDILDDDEFGTYVPGPYGRRDALLRSSVSDPNSGVR